jgi:hypothetical protein
MSDEDRFEFELSLTRKLTMSLTEAERDILEEVVFEAMDDHQVYRDLLENPYPILEGKGMSTETVSRLTDVIHEIGGPPTIQHLVGIPGGGQETE